MAHLIDETDPNQKSCGKVFQPNGLMAHLEKKGQICILHFGTRKYIEKLSEKRKHLSKSTHSSFFCDGKGGGLLLSNGERPNPLSEQKLLNVEVGNVRQSLLPGKKTNVTIHFEKGNSHHTINSSPSSSLLLGEGFFLSNGESTNPIAQNKLVSHEDMGNKVAHISNQVLNVITDGKSKGESDMVEDVPLEEENAPIDEVFHEAVISRHSAMGKDNELPQQPVEHPALQLAHRQAEMQVKKQTVQPSEPTQNQIEKHGNPFEPEA